MELIIVEFSMLVICLNIILPFVARFFNIKLKPAYLSCGLVGYCGDTPADPTIIKILLMYNMERGEDSTGWAVNNKITKATDKVTLFIRNNPLVITPEDSNYTVIAHARKTSSGARYNKELAHPFGMYKGSTEKEQYDLILAMNGTLANLEEFCDFFKADYKSISNSDTQMLARIMCDLGEKDYMQALEKYSGTATLLFTSPKFANTLMVYKDEQRPLFYWQKSKSELYTSSLKEALESVASGGEIHPFLDGNLYKINKGKVVKTVVIDRTNVIKPITKSYSYKGKNSGHNNQQVAGSWIGNHDTNTMEREVSNAGKESFTNKKCHSRRENAIYLHCDRYWRNGHPVTGMRYVNDKGELSDIKKEGYDEYWFFFGYMCKDEKSYNEAFTLMGKGKDEVDIEKYKARTSSENINFFKYPVSFYIDENTAVFRWILNEEWEKKAVNDSLDLDFFLSNSVLTLKYTNKRTTPTKKAVYEEFIVKLKSKIDKKSVHDSALTIIDGSPLDNLKKRFPNKNFSKAEIKRRILEAGEIAWPGNILSDFKIHFWMVNIHHEVDEYYYELLFELFLSAGIATKNELDAVFLEGITDFKKMSFLNEVKSLTSLYVKYNDTLGKDAYYNENTSDNVGIQEQLLSIQQANTVYSNESFRRTFYDPQTDILDVFSEDWISSVGDQKEINHFREAVMLCLFHIGRVTLEEFVEFIDNPTDPIVTRSIEREFTNHYKKIKGIDKDSITSEDITSNNVIDSMSEAFDSETFEEDMIQQYIDIMNSLKENCSHIELTATDNIISIRTTEILGSMKELLNRMKVFAELKAS